VRERRVVGRAHVEPDVLAVDADVRVADDLPRRLRDEDVLPELDVGRLPVLEQVAGVTSSAPWRRRECSLSIAAVPSSVLAAAGRIVVMARPARRGCPGSLERSVSSRSGLGSGCSPRRFIQTLLRPSSRAGAMSWKRLAGNVGV
jgi:hypothetical protein